MTRIKCKCPALCGGFKIKNVNTFENAILFLNNGVIREYFP